MHQILSAFFSFHWCFLCTKCHASLHRIQAIHKGHTHPVHNASHHASTLTQSACYFLSIFPSLIFPLRRASRLLSSSRSYILERLHTHNLHFLQCLRSSRRRCHLIADPRHKWTDRVKSRGEKGGGGGRGLFPSEGSGALGSKTK